MISNIDKFKIENIRYEKPFVQRRDRRNNQAGVTVMPFRKAVVDLRVIYFNDIKYKVNKTKQESIRRLQFEYQKTTIREKMLRNISSKYTTVWKLFQNRMKTLSMVRNVIRRKRILGIPGKIGLQIQNKEQNRRNSKVWRGRVFRDSWFFAAHNLVLMFCFVLGLLLIPLDIAFSYSSYSPVLFFIKHMIIFYLIIDIILRFLTVINHETSIVREFAQIAKHYISSWNFLLDIAGSIPVELFMKENSRFSKETSVLFDLLTVARIVLPLFTISQYSLQIPKQIKSLIQTRRVVSLFRTAIITLIFVHCSACLMVYIVTLSPADKWVVR